MSSRFVGVRKDGNIGVVSSSPFACEDLSTHEVPSTLHDKAPIEIITDYRMYQHSIVRKDASSVPHFMKVALVGNWKTHCGIATYAEHIWPEVAKLVGNVKLFIEHNDTLAGDITVFGDTVLSPDKVVRCWRRGDSLNELGDAIEAYSPDIVWVQHEFGIWPNARHWLSFMSRMQERSRVVITAHSVFHHKDKTVCEAAMPNIVVHTQGGADVLKLEKHVSGAITVISHGCTPCTDTTRLWNAYMTNNTFMQFGFGFRYKGWELSIRTVHELKKTYQDVFFTGLFSESQFARQEHKTYYDELIRLIDELGIRENIALLRGYQSDEALDSFMRTNNATVFPYVSGGEHEVFGASGAARVAMSTGIPVVTTSANHFLDLPTLKANTPEALAAVLSNIFSDDTARQTQVERQVTYTLENSWARCAERYVAVFVDALAH
jgi:glycosyltransferase involved in cell wall biosynthesis